MSRRPPPTLAAERFGRDANERDRVETRDQIGRDGNDDAGFPVAGDAYDRDDSRPDGLLGFVRQRFQILHLDTRYGLAEKFDPLDLGDGLRAGTAFTSHRKFLARLGQVTIEPAAVLDQARQSRYGVVLGRFQKARNNPQSFSLGVEMMARRAPGLRLDAAHACRDGTLRNDGDQTDIAGAFRVSSTAELDGKTPARADRIPRYRKRSRAPSKRREPRRRISRRTGRARLI